MPSRWKKFALAATALVVVLGSGALAPPALAQSWGYHDERERERDHAPRLQVGPGGVQFDSGSGQHEPDYRRHHRQEQHDCRRVEYQDHHGDYRVRMVCDED